MRKTPVMICMACAVAMITMGDGKLIAAEYQNDFSTRTNEVRGMDGWLAMPYANGAVAYNFDETKFWPTLPYEDASKVQDGWVKARLNSGGTAADVEVVGTDNRYLRFTATSAVAGTAVMQTFGNEFSNGVLRIRCDLRALGSWSWCERGANTVDATWRMKALRDWQGNGAYIAADFPVDAYDGGWVSGNGGHFEFERLPGIPQRFYGVNLCGSANTPPPVQARSFAARLARMGYNAVRVHHHEKALTKTDGFTLDQEQMLWFRNFVDACTENGLYITTDLFVVQADFGDALDRRTRFWNSVWRFTPSYASLMGTTSAPYAEWNRTCFACCRQRRLPRLCVVGGWL